MATFSPSWELNRAALERYCARVGLSWGVIVTRTHAKRHYAIYRTTPDRFDACLHYISIDKTLAPAAASRMLRHELEHARQAEQAGSWVRWYAGHKAEHKLAYQDRPREIAARLAENLNTDIRLTRKPKSARLQP